MRVVLEQLGEITDEVAAASYGIPVLLVKGEPYGPLDYLSCDGKVLPAHRVAVRWLEWFHSRPECECESDEQYGKLVWTQHTPECEAILKALNKWMEPTAQYIQEVGAYL